MHLCDRAEITRHLDVEDLIIDPGAEREITYLDEHRVGLHIAQMFTLYGAVDLARPEVADVRSVPVDSACLQPGSCYLGLTREKIRLGNGFAASLHTRSRYARLGFELLGSSNVVVPGFGSVDPAPLVFEMSVRQVTTGLSSTTAYCFLLLYRIDRPRRTPNLADYLSRFPLQRTDKGSSLKP